MLRQIILDTETTGLKVEEGHRIIEIGCVEMINRKLTGKHFHYYFNPERPVDAGAFAVHGLSDAFLQDKPLFASIAQSLVDFLWGAELIIHNAPFDLSFLQKELSLAGLEWKPQPPYCSVIDTLVMARQLHVGQRNSLDALCKRYNVDLSKREMHGALLDSRLLAQVYLAMTGGQGSFFDGEQDRQVISKDAEFSHSAKKKPSYQLVVISATEEELHAHNNYLEEMKKQAQVIWEDGK